MEAGCNINMVGRYFFNILLGLDQFVNVVLLGDPDESISGRLGRAQASGKAKWFVPALRALVDWGAKAISGQSAHCASSIEPEDQAYSKEIWSWIRG